VKTRWGVEVLENGDANSLTGLYGAYAFVKLWFGMYPSSEIKEYCAGCRYGCWDVVHGCS
jgi:hypothetical protein